MKRRECGYRRRRHAFYTSAFVTAAVLITIAANAAAIWLDRSAGLSADVSNERYTILTQESKDVLSRLNQNVYLYYMGGSETDDLRVTELLKNYAAESDRVFYSFIDPAWHPGFTRMYDPEQKGIETGCVIVSDSDGMNGSSPGRYKVLDKDELYQTSVPYYDETGTLVSDYRYFKAERSVTSAIEYIMTQKSCSVVFLSGENEKQPCGNFLEDLAAQYYGTRVSDLTDAPLDPQTDTLMVVGPQSDMSAEVSRKIGAFINKGGKAVFLMDTPQDSEAAFGRFEALFAGFGLAAKLNVIIGEDPKNTFMSRTNLIPSLNPDAAITAPIAREKHKPVLSFAGEVTISAAAGVNVSKLLETDKASYAKPRLQDSEIYGKNEGDETGPFVIGALAEKGGAAIVLYGSSSFVTSDDNYAIPGNRMLAINTLGYLSGRQQTDVIPIRTVYSASDDAYALNIPSAAERLLVIVLTAAVLPLAVLLVGLSKWFSRRRL